MASTTDKIGHGLAKVLGIKLEQHHHDPVTRGESAFSVNTSESYVEEEPRTSEWLREHAPTPRAILAFVLRLFPFLSWIRYYNLQWLYGDLVAGITVGAVVVPQSMAYAKLANLAPEFGLYSSFMGVILYWFFATSKDITIGPVAVMSTIVGQIVNNAKKVDPTIPPYVVASALAIILGAITFGLGFIRFGWITELISLASITAFMTGSAINIAVGQVPSLLGISSTHVYSRDSTYLVVIHVLQNLRWANGPDAGMGVSALVMLYAIRSIFNYLAKKAPQHKKLWFFLSTLRTVFVILLYVLISWLVNRNIPNHDSSKAVFSILGTVPRGFQHAGVPQLNSKIISTFTGDIPIGFIVLLIEHISISKSFGRVNNYTIDPSQELVAIGVTNLLAPFLGAYPATGSFSRTAIKSKAGVRTPLAGVITGIIVLLAIYALPAVFFYIPNATLSAVIIHAVGDLITPPNTVYQFWRVSPLEVVIFFAGVITIIFSTIEYGVYVTIAASAFLYVWRLFHARGRFLGRVQVHSVANDSANDNEADKKTDAAASKTRGVFLPTDNGDGSNPTVAPQLQPYPGVFVYRLNEGFNFPNAGLQLEHLTEIVFSQTRRTNPFAYARPGDRPWNDPAPRKDESEDKPTLRAIVLDFSSVNNVDITSLQALIDVRNQLDRYASPDKVQWHFAGINNRWTKRALVSAGFGLPPVEGIDAPQWKALYSVAEIGGPNSAAADAEERARAQFARSASRHGDIERGQSAYAQPQDEIGSESSASNHSLDKQLATSYARQTGPSKTTAPVTGLNRPFFHVDAEAALESAVYYLQFHKPTQEFVPDNSEIKVDGTGEVQGKSAYV